jgi:UDP-2,3-diacylglucosamine hydrolase
VEEGAIFIADVHYRPGDRWIEEKFSHLLQLSPPQLFLVGDIFHLLVNLPPVIEKNRRLIEIISKIADKIPTFYLEGNHDFNLETIFPTLQVGEGVWDKGQNIKVTHGDWGEGWGYALYTKIIRSPLFLTPFRWKLLSPLTNWIIDKILQKPIKCSPIPNFIDQILTKKRWEGTLIEGHYHQRVKWKGKTSSHRYFSIPSFYCTGEIGIWKKGDLEWKRV